MCNCETCNTDPQEEYSRSIQRAVGEGDPSWYAVRHTSYRQRYPVKSCCQPHLSQAPLSLRSASAFRLRVSSYADLTQELESALLSPSSDLWPLIQLIGSVALLTPPQFSCALGPMVWPGMSHSHDAHPFGFGDHNGTQPQLSCP